MMNRARKLAVLSVATLLTASACSALANCTAVDPVAEAAYKGATDAAKRNDSLGARAAANHNCAGQLRTPAGGEQSS